MSRNRNGDMSLVETKPLSGSFSTRASNFVYSAHGAVSGMQLGNGSFESAQFNSRLQPTQIALGTTANGTDKLKLDYTYGTTNNNGNVQSQTITVPGLAQPFVQTYGYDELNRLANATETNNGSQQWNQTFGFDRYGNRNITAGVGQTNLTFDASNNKITTSGYSYDAVGSTTADPSGKTFAYDGENKQGSVVNGGTTVGVYTYDADGKRVAKNNSEDMYFVYDAGGRLIEERNSWNGKLQKTYIYAGSRLLSIETSTTTSYLTNDHLGSPRINTNASGTVTARHDYMPFGEEITSSITPLRSGYASDTVRKKFTGYERDDESGLDFAKARYFSATLGRFTVVDPVLITPYRMVNPQALNPYSYVANTPLKFTDPTGKIIKFRNEADAKKAVLLYQSGLKKDQQNAVSYTKDKSGNFILKIDAKSAEKAGGGSLLGRLAKAASFEKVAMVDFVKNDTGFEKIQYGIESSKAKTSMAQEVASSEGRITELAGLTLPEFGGKDNPKYNYASANSAEKGVTRILINTEAKKFSMSQAIYAETLAHFQTLIETGDARKAVHPTVDDDERSIIEEVKKNENSSTTPVKKP